MRSAKELVPQAGEAFVSCAERAFSQLGLDRASAAEPASQTSAGSASGVWAELLEAQLWFARAVVGQSCALVRLL